MSTVTPYADFDAGTTATTCTCVQEEIATVSL